MRASATWPAERAIPKLVVGRRPRRDHRGPDGREYLDFVGGIGCQNLGHGPEKVVAAVHAQVDRFLHQMSMVVSYEGYVEVCRLLAESSPCAGTSKSMLINSGAEAIENAVKISRAATGRPAVLVFDRAFHGRTLLAMTMTSKLVYKKTFGPFAPEIYRVAAPVRVPGHLERRRDRARSSSRSRRRWIPSRWPAPCSSPCRARAASSRCRSTSRRASRSCSTATASSTWTTRSSPAAAAPGRCGRSSTTASSPTS